MLILAIDTSAVASAALVTDDAPESVLASFATEDTRSHAEVLAPGIHAMLANAGVTGQDVDALVVGVGPGPFTGLRSGATRPRRAPSESTAAVAEFLVVTDARRKEVYWARYTLDDGQLPVLADGPHVGFASDLRDLPAFGAGAGLYADVLQAHPDFAAEQPDALYLGQFALARLAAGDTLLDSTPLYLRESDAQVPGPRKRAL